MSRLPLTFVPAKSGNDEFLYSLFAATRWALPAGMFSPGAALESIGRRQYAMREMQYGAKYGEGRQVVLCGGVPAGSVWVWRDAAEVRVVDIAVAPAFQRRGIASVILTSLCNEAAATRVPVRLTVDRSNTPAIELYRRLRFRIIEESETDWLMEWSPAVANGAGD